MIGIISFIKKYFGIPLITEGVKSFYNFLFKKIEFKAAIDQHKSTVKKVINPDKASVKIGIALTGVTSKALEIKNVTSTGHGVVIKQSQFMETISIGEVNIKN